MLKMSIIILKNFW